MDNHYNDINHVYGYTYTQNKYLTTILLTYKCRKKCSIGKPCSLWEISIPTLCNRCTLMLFTIAVPITDM